MSCGGKNIKNRMISWGKSRKKRRERGRSKIYAKGRKRKVEKVHQH
jgi:hypothetical protein